jgi:hypothetical protein
MLPEHRTTCESPTCGMIRRGSHVEREGEWVCRRIRTRRGKRLAGLKDERGVALTEFALVLPILLLVLAGILTFGRIFFYWLDANRLAGETARWAVVDQNPFGATTLQQHVIDSVPNGMKDARVCIGFIPNADLTNPGSGRVGDPLEVRVEKSVSLIPIFDIGDEITIRASSTMRMEHFASDTGLPSAFRPEDNLPTPDVCEPPPDEGA